MLRAVLKRIQLHRDALSIEGDASPIPVPRPAVLDLLQTAEGLLNQNVSMRNLVVSAAVEVQQLREAIDAAVASATGCTPDTLARMDALLSLVEDRLALAQLRDE